MKVIIDTNLWISFLIGKKLSALQLLCNDNRLTLYICSALTDEFIDVSSRAKIRKYITEQDVVDTLKLMEAYCVSETISISATSPVRDVKDLYLLSLADTILADYIVTGDKDLLVLQQHNQTKILTYTAFMSILNSENN